MNNTIGYIERDWLSALDIDSGAQTDFYRGWIKEKGSLNALNSYGRSYSPSFNTVINVNEEYAMKVGIYGSDSRTGYGEVSLPPSINTVNPLVVSFVSSPNSSFANIIQVTPNTLYEKSSNWTNNFIQKYGNLELNEKSFQDAGPIVPEILVSQNANIIQTFSPVDQSALFFSNLSSVILEGANASLLKIVENGGSIWIEDNETVNNNNNRCWMAK